MQVFQKLPIVLVGVAVLIGGCGDGALEVRHGDEFDADADAGAVDDANGVEPSNDTGVVEDTGDVEDAGVVEDTGADDAGSDNDDNGEEPPPCEIGEFECQGDAGYRVCVDDGDDSARWDDETCSGDQLCADAADSLDEICQTCPDDQFAPDNHTSPNAPSLSAGDSYSGLRLCEEPHGQNFFYLGETDSIEVQLEWEEHGDSLRMDVWIAEGSGVSWEGRDWYALASHGSFEAETAESFSGTEHIYVRVYYPDEYSPPSSGVSYEISRSN